MNWYLPDSGIERTLSQNPLLCSSSLRGGIVGGSEVVVKVVAVVVFAVRDRTRIVTLENCSLEDVDVRTQNKQLELDVRCPADSGPLCVCTQPSRRLHTSCWNASKAENLLARPASIAATCTERESAHGDGTQNAVQARVVVRLSRPWNEWFKAQGAAEMRFGGHLGLLWRTCRQPKRQRGVQSCVQNSRLTRSRGVTELRTRPKALDNLRVVV